MYFSSLETICMQISFCNISLLLETARLHPQLSFILSCHLQQHRDADGQWKASGLKLKIPKELFQPETIRGGLLLEGYLLLCCSGSVDQVFLHHSVRWSSLHWSGVLLTALCATSLLITCHVTEPKR